MDFLKKSTSYFIDIKYGDIYTFFKEKYAISYHELFLNFVVIGYKNGKTEQIKARGKEFKTTYFNDKQKALIYTLMLHNTQYTINDLENEQFSNITKSCMEGYANAGAEIFTEELKYKWKDNVLDKDYLNYDLDLIYFLETLSNEIPF